MTTSADASTWQPTLGAIVGEEGTRFRVWATKPSRVELVLYGGGGEQAIPMERDGEDWVVTVKDVGPGKLYKYRLDGGEAYPDPASRGQPEGVHGPSEVVDPSLYAWHDQGWRPPAVSDLSIYECHIGTLTPEGTFDSAISQLARLKGLGVTAIELMPVASFRGRWSWGYDGVALYAPDESYGGPEGLRRLVDAAHEAGLAVILDVVYNHFGPSGNYTSLYSEQYFTRKHHTAWGAAVNFDDVGSQHVRCFFLENLLSWVYEYHIDGFRLDATHAIQDSSRVHILAELSQQLEAHRRSGHKAYMIAETHENDVKYFRPVSEGGYGFDAVWADDFHHVVRTLITGEREGYFSNYEGTAEELAMVIERGFYYEGQQDRFLGEKRGAAALEQPWYQFVYCIQNHDQVGNRALGQRLNVTASHADFLAASMLLLLLPQTPLLFQGQEFLASSPFLYFTDHESELGRLVTEGRRKEFGAFAAFADPRMQEFIPDPQDPMTFLRSKLPLDEAEYGAGLLCQTMYRTLLDLRMSDPVLRSSRTYRSDVRATPSEKAVLVELRADEGRRVIAANFGGDAELPLEGAGRYEVVTHTGEPRYGGNGVAPEAEGDVLRVPAHSAAFLRPRDAACELMGSLRDKDIPGWETSEAAVEWVRGLRRESDGEAGT